MSEELETIRERATRLSPAERVQLIDALFSSLQSEESRQIERAWVQESDSRLQAYDAGEISSVSWQELRERLQRKP
jgi:putative addiction module component (TIGR02574 family)